jgi:hypothetical protein
MGSNIVEFGDYLFIEEDFNVVTRAEFFKTLPVNYEYLRKKYQVIGKASKRAILVGSKMNPERTIVLEKKPERIRAVAKPVQREEVVDSEAGAEADCDVPELEKKQTDFGSIELPFKAFS